MIIGVAHHHMFHRGILKDELAACVSDNIPCINLSSSLAPYMKSRVIRDDRLQSSLRDSSCIVIIIEKPSRHYLFSGRAQAFTLGISLGWQYPRRTSS